MNAARYSLTSSVPCAMFVRLVWAGPFVLHATDSYAWGLYTHMYFAQLLIWSIPLADRRFRRALGRFPELFLAATCLHDISLFSGTMRTPQTRVTHQWSAAIAMLRDAEHAAERAMALGYATHLLTDVVAHNQFVPTHERLWLRSGLVTHAMSEWAMDAHVSQHLFVTPAAVLSGHLSSLSAFAEDRLAIERPIARQALSYLLCGERLLRRTRVPHLIYGTCRHVDRELVERFDRYVRETSQRLRQINRLIAGDVPAWLPEVESEPEEADRERNAPVLPTDLFGEASLELP
jgi:Zinc dependent phospholipase C